MATSDLLAELSKDTFKPDSDSERKICKCLLKLINDQSSDVQSLAVKCLSPLVRKVHEVRWPQCGHAPCPFRPVVPAPCTRRLAGGMLILWTGSSPRALRSWLTRSQCRSAATC